MNENKGVYRLSQQEKNRRINRELRELTKIHKNKCEPYRRLCGGLKEEMPFVPVSAFKDLELKSVPESEIVKIITSSGTSGERVSRIFLDRETANLQQKALCEIAGDFIGNQRLPMLVIDSRNVLRDRRGFSARGAGILGFSILSAERCYALDEQMHLLTEEITAFLKKHEGENILVFGFTYIVWEYFCQELKRRGLSLDLSNGYLIHGGGWKKMQQIAVSEDVFARELKRVCGIRHISSYYGMAEQTGSIFMECECGHLHASCYSDIRVLRAADFSECDTGEEGILALSSVLAKSYPGHRILTEDLGILLGTDHCPCGRKGSYFKVTGRIPKTGLRGCSDVLAESRAKKTDANIFLAAGVLKPKPRKAAVFDELAVGFLTEVSEYIRKKKELQRYPDLCAFGFWCRPANLKAMKRQGRRGKGLVFHIVPSNMPVMFAYSWAVGLLAGNGNVVRLPGQSAPETDILCNLIEELFQKETYRELKECSSFVRYRADRKVTQMYSECCQVRIIWGSDDTVRSIQKIPLAKGASDIIFPDKYSIAVLSVSYILEQSEEELCQLAYRFYQDTYGADQNACSSPITVFWLTGEAAREEISLAKDRWHTALAEQAKAYPLDFYKSVAKYQKLCRAYLEQKGLEPVKRFGNRLYIIPCKELPEHLWELSGVCGMFFEKDIKETSELYPLMEAKIQTIAAAGICKKQLYDEIRAAGCPGVDRVVSPGEALVFDPVWDRKDLYLLLTEER